jgi:hypothetical protein
MINIGAVIGNHGAELSYQLYYPAGQYRNLKKCRNCSLNMVFPILPIITNREKGEMKPVKETRS